MGIKVEFNPDLALRKFNAIINEIYDINNPEIYFEGMNKLK